MKHLALLRNKNSYWQLVGSQSTQDIAQRIEKAYQLFFKYHKRGDLKNTASHIRPPTFKKKKKYKSFTLKQAGYKFIKDNRLKIGEKMYKFGKSREILGKIKTVTIKRNHDGELFLLIVTDYVEPKTEFMSGNIAGFDFGLKTFLTISRHPDIKSPLFLKQSLNQLRIASRNHSQKNQGSANRERARKNLVRVHEKVVNRRTDWFWKLAHDLTNKFDYLFFETLNLKAMQRLWGRKVSDLAFAKFLKILQWVATKKGKVLGLIDRWYASTKICNQCDYKLEELTLDVRRWRCPCCQKVNDRDKNASYNLEKVGISTYGLGDVSRFSTAIAV
jgi:putative transposase